MVKTPSTMLPLGTPAPSFALPEPASGRTTSLDDFAGSRALLVMFLSNHCPFVKHIAGALADFGREYDGQGLAIVAINANDVANYPDDSPEKMAEEVERRGYPARIPGAVRCESSRQRRAHHGKGLAESVRRGADGGHPVRGADPQRGVQHQVEAGQQPALVRLK
jgi:thiol-disulfide isomerase/thioredoxin